jgi:hypothetical protein
LGALRRADVDTVVVKPLANGSKARDQTPFHGPLQMHFRWRDRYGGSGLGWNSRDLRFRLK